MLAGLACLAAVLVPSAARAGTTLAPADFEASFNVGKDQFLIKARKTFVELAYQHGEKIEFSVYRNGKFIHPEDANGGTIIGCRQAYTTPKERDPIEPLLISGERRGWWIVTGGSCGTRSTKLHAAVLPPMRAEQSTYEMYVVRSAGGAFARKAVDGNGIEVWSFKYFADCGAFTLSYPKMDVIDGHARLPTDPARWPKSSDFGQADSKDTNTIYPNDYTTRFLAGIANKDVALLNASRTAFKLGQRTPWQIPKECRPEFLPDDERELEKIIAAFATLDHAGVLVAPLAGP
jgi:hypothetical protein